VAEFKIIPGSVTGGAVQSNDELHIPSVKLQLAKGAPQQSLF
jgi:hypothetical protein